MHLTSYFYVILAVALTGISQILLKIGAQNTRKSLGIYMNIYTLTGYLSFLMVTIFSLLALREMELKLFFAFTSLNYIIVAILSRFFLKECLSKRKVFYLGVIVIGVIIFNL